VPYGLIFEPKLGKYHKHVSDRTAIGGCQLFLSGQEGDRYKLSCAYLAMSTSSIRTNKFFGSFAPSDDGMAEWNIRLSAAKAAESLGEEIAKKKDTKGPKLIVILLIPDPEKFSGQRNALAKAVKSRANSIIRSLAASTSLAVEFYLATVDTSSIGLGNLLVDPDHRVHIGHVTLWDGQKCVGD